MKFKTFLSKFFSIYLWGNILAMIILGAALCLGVKYGLDVYTRHGKSIRVPDLHGMDYARAKPLLEQCGLGIIVGDSGYNKRMAAGCVLMQTPGAGANVKAGRLIYVTVNSHTSPTVAIPDIIDNSSLREAEAKLKAMGFRLLNPQFITGEKDWVYGISGDGRRLMAGEKVSVDMPLALVIGNGQFDTLNVDMDFSDPDAGMGDVDEFEEIDVPVIDDVTE
ncbi:PASTA domain-containing protein [Xylanibacter muris]|uniref:PASTA domain-containing protein n=1 Tax=Xylanibacter muris TaxID=2736290 RepID=A0ABX2ASP2_9BACT|nr:PASTA domain-containing protein [Xylanibacter muris]NPD93220.1 PASTA domain-containing protein [Xylanibacter muris]